jgi:hypothetical protein
MGCEIINGNGWALIEFDGDKCLDSGCVGWDAMIGNNWVWVFIVTGFDAGWDTSSAWGKEQFQK